MSFPTDPLDVRLVFAFGANLTASPTTWTWKDVTALGDLRVKQEIGITVGRSDRAKRSAPNNAALVLNNMSGQYTVDNPASPNFPNVVENVPGILAVRRNLNPTFEVDASDWTAVQGTVVRSTVRAVKGNASGLLTPTGGFTFASADIITRVPIRARGAVYVDAWVFSVAGWANTWTAVDWYDPGNVYIVTTVGPTVAVPAGAWTYLGAYIGPGPANAASAVGRVIEGGTPGAGNTLWIDEARISVPEMCGYVDGWTPLSDDSGKLHTVAAPVSSSRRRLGQGDPPADSALKRTILASKPVIYWSFEGGPLSTVVGSELPGGAVMRVNPLAKFGALDGPAGSGKLFDLAPVNVAGLGGVAGEAVGLAGAGTDFEISWLFRLGGLTGAGDFVVRWLTGTDPTTQQWDSFMSDLQMTVRVGGPGGTVILQWITGTLNDGAWHHARVRAMYAGGSRTAVLFVDGVSRATDFRAGTGGNGLSNPMVLTADTAGAQAVQGFGHLAGWTPPPGTSVPYSAVLGYPGETAADRITRLCGEMLAPVATITNAGNSMAMGAQAIKADLELLQDCEDADGGLLHEPFDTFGFDYIVRSDLYNLPVALTIDRAAGQLAPPYAPKHDDAGRANDVTVTRQGGASARARGDTSRGTYKDAPTVNVATDDVLPHIAGWRAHLGSPRAKLRFPSLSLQFANPAAAALGPQWSATRGVGVRVRAINMPAQIPQTVDMLVTGYTKRLGYRSWAPTLLGPQYEPWLVFIVGDPAQGRIDTAGSQLTGGPYNAGVTSLSVQTNSGPLWITTALKPSKFPFDAEIAGYRITVTGIAGVASPQTFTVSATPSALANGAPVKLWRPAGLAL